jgi:hypothetical protein
MTRSTPSSRARLVALMMLGLAAAFLADARTVGAAAAYLGLLAAVIIVLSLVAAQRLWFGGHIDGRVLACVLAGVAFVGQVLDLTVGLPGAESLRNGRGLLGVAALLLEVAVAWTLAGDRVLKPASV